MTGMTTTPSELPTDRNACHQLIRELLQTLAQQTHLVEKLQRQLEQLLRRGLGCGDKSSGKPRLMWRMNSRSGRDPVQWTPRPGGESPRR
jgi:hypothetical protein